MFVNFNILNQLGSPAINSNTFANRPAAGQTGRLFVSTDTFEIYRDNGTTWDLIGGPGTSTITGTGTATQVAYFTSSQAIGSSADLYWDNTNTRLGIGTSSPGVRLDVHGTGVMMHINSTSATANSLMSIQRTGTNVWRIGDNYNSGDNFFELRNSVLSNDALTIQATTNKAAFLAQQTYSTGQAQGALFTYNLTAPAGTTFATPNALSAVNAFLNLSLGGNATLPAGTRQGIEGNSRVSFTGAGTLTMSQGSTLRAYAAITGVHSFAGSAVGTITHLAGIRLCFPDNIGSAINITNNYGLLINDQSAGTGTITYTNRWGIYQEGASDLNYFAANTLIGSTVNNGAALQVTGTSTFSSTITATGTIQSNDQNAFWLYQPSNPLDTKYWAIQNLLTSGTFRIRALNDAVSNGINALTIDRTGIGSITTSFPNGNVGIGTSSPATLLDLFRASYPILQISSGTVTGNIGIDTASNFLNVGASSNHPLVLSTNNTERMRITSGGVGIGTVSPGAALNVSGINVAAAIDWTNTTPTTGRTYRWVSLNSGGFAIEDITGGGLKMVVASSGNVLIGTTTDNGNKVQVNGNLQNYANIGSNSVTVSALLTNYQILNSAYNGILVIRDNQAGGTDLWIIDPNLGTIKIGGNITKTYTITYSAGVYNINQSAGTVPVTYTTNVLGA